ncbi:MAG TPA: hypothetical protein VGE95_07380 [Arthrobacter sp.]
MTETKTGLARLREPFSPNQINKLPKPYRADSQKGQCRECGGYHGLPAVHLDYVGHAALTDRLLEVDPEWFWEPLAIGPDGLPQFDKDGGLWIRLTICGVTRLGYGDSQGKRGANAVKEAIGDALRNAGMRFGAALDLWHKGDLHDASEEQGKLEAPAEEPAPAPARTLQRATVDLDEWKKKLEGKSKADLQALWKASKDEGQPESVLALIVAAGNAAA